MKTQCDRAAFANIYERGKCWREREREIGPGRLTKEGREKSRRNHSVEGLPFFEEGSREGKAN